MNVDGPRRNRTLSLKYHLLKRDEVVEVCQNFFLNTLDISRRQIRTVLEKVMEAGTLEPDQRGHDTRRKIDNAIHNGRSGRAYLPIQNSGEPLCL